MDTTYADPVVEDTTEETSPVSHRKVTGRFEGTDIRFEIHLPPAEDWQGRFFQYTYPLTDEKALDEYIVFGAENGGYTVQAGNSSISLGYRHAAAAAKFAKQVAADYYGVDPDSINGYLWGLSGGSLQTIGAMENTFEVWDGFVPVVIATPQDAFAMRSLGRFVLAEKADGISDALLPGGSGDPRAGLDEAETAVFDAMEAWGIPLAGWEDPTYLLGLHQDTPLAGPENVRNLDPTYESDFWTLPGYLGTEESPLGDFFRSARVDTRTSIASVTHDANGTATLITPEAALVLPDHYGLEIALVSDDGTETYLKASLTPDGSTISLNTGNPPEVLEALTSGAELRVTNGWSLASFVHYRHQVPSLDEGWTPFDHVRDEDGEPLYAQRPMLRQTRSVASGYAKYSGAITGKVIMVDNLADVDALPVYADWYSGRVLAELGETEHQANFRLYFNESADHVGPISETSQKRMVDFIGIVEQALREVSLWAEGVETAASSSEYVRTNNQIVLAEGADERGGLQPVVELSVAGEQHYEATTGSAVNLTAEIQAIPGQGKVILVEWDPEGTGTFTEVPFGDPTTELTSQLIHEYSTAGTYFPAVRVTTHHAGDRSAKSNQVRNLNRARVTVTDVAPMPSTSPSPTTPSTSPSPTMPPSASSTPSAPSSSDLYSTPGFHSVNGRWWYTRCEPYSQTIRCRTEIWATTVELVSGRFVQTSGWVFNNLTYLPHMTRAQWMSNPLGHAGEWTATDGRRWKTECDTAATGQNGCRSWVWSSFVASSQTPSGAWTHRASEGWQLNNIVRFLVR